MADLVECQACKAVSKPQLRGSTLISFVLFWIFAMVPGIIYMIWRRGGLGVCANCKSSAVIPYVKRLEQNQVPRGASSALVAHDAFSYNAGNHIQKDAQNAETKSCPFCAEDIRLTAIKCKHCGSDLSV